ncbi:LANO_0A00430g1_1 [Lachancea nothofagi CBS 11611]|uniref:LANO_0A00430g1_1 n=1 Tax=Lachancea nothofagi CBS 11611 TaxID=1266666 RepID=A0A1G4IM69_9SACH|nr:LANO_0A00430g1_1 [Lachancea nothofagi CBS 11611]
MYIPKAFEVTDEAKQFDLIRENPLGVLFSYAPESNGILGYFKPADAFASMCATHVPFVIVKTDEGKSRLVTHIAKNNKHADFLEKQNDCMVVFQGPSNYISPSWYPLKKKTHKFVPTYDYSAVHIYGKAKVIRGDKRWLLEMLNAVTDQEEGKRPDGDEYEEKWAVSDAPADLIDAKMNNIVGVEIEIERMETQFKAHQNQHPINVEGVAENLPKECGEKGKSLADFMLQEYPRKDELQAPSSN